MKQGNYLIGGNELKQLISANIHSPNPIDPHKIYLFPNRKDLVNKDTLFEDELIKKAFSRICNDLEDKKSDISKFVSFRIHVSRSIWRMNPEMEHENSQFQLDHSVNEIWTLGRCDEANFNYLKIKPKELIIVPALEELILPSNVYGFLQTRTTVALKGLDITPTNIIVPGFAGCLHLQVKNNTSITIQIPDFYPVAELFVFFTVGNYSGAGSAYQNTVNEKNLEKTINGENISFKRSAKAILIYLMAIIPVLTIAYFLRKAFPVVSEEIFNQSLFVIFIICSLAFIAIVFGKDIVEMVLSKITGKSDKK
jgi:deoxycytidine triphosphate deaminase